MCAYHVLVPPDSSQTIAANAAGVGRRVYGCAVALCWSREHTRTPPDGRRCMQDLAGSAFIQAAASPDFDHEAYGLRELSLVVTWHSASHG